MITMSRSLRPAPRTPALADLGFWSQGGGGAARTEALMLAAPRHGNEVIWYGEAGRWAGSTFARPLQHLKEHPRGLLPASAARQAP